MKRFTLMACAGLMAAAMATPSLAADLPRPAYKAPVFVAPFSWSGFYVGINGGYGWGTARLEQRRCVSHSVKPNGGLVGGTLGYNLADRQLGLGPGRRYRLPADSKALTPAPALCAGGIGCETQNRGSVRPAAASAMPSTAGCLTSPAACLRRRAR